MYWDLNSTSTTSRQKDDCLTCSATNAYRHASHNWQRDPLLWLPLLQTRRCTSKCSLSGRGWFCSFIVTESVLSHGFCAIVGTKYHQVTGQSYIPFYWWFKGLPILWWTSIYARELPSRFIDCRVSSLGNWQNAKLHRWGILQQRRLQADIFFTLINVTEEACTYAMYKNKERLKE